MSGRGKPFTLPWEEETSCPHLQCPTQGTAPSLAGDVQKRANNAETEGPYNLKWVFTPEGAKVLMVNLEF